MTDSEPFYVPQHLRHRFRGVNAFGYLPPLEVTGCDLKQEEPSPVGLRPQDWQYEKLQARLTALQSKLNQHLDESRPKKPGNASTYQGLSIE